MRSHELRVQVLGEDHPDIGRSLRVWVQASNSSGAVSFRKFPAPTSGPARYFSSPGRRSGVTVLFSIVSMFAGLALISAGELLAHLADNQLTRGLRLSAAQRLAKVPLGWFTGQASGEVKQAMQDGFSTGRSLGLGLPGAKRLANIVEQRAEKQRRTGLE